MEAQAAEAPPLNVTANDIANALGQSKRRISATKGECFDMLSDRLTNELAGVHNMCTQLITEIERLRRENAVLKKDLETFVPKKEKVETSKKP